LSEKRLACHACDSCTSTASFKNQSCQCLPRKDFKLIELANPYLKSAKRFHFYCSMHEAKAQKAEKPLIIADQGL
jgi:hypothetical protein